MRIFSITLLLIAASCQRNLDVRVLSKSILKHSIGEYQWVTAGGRWEKLAGNLAKTPFPNTVDISCVLAITRKRRFLNIRRKELVGL